MSEDAETTSRRSLLKSAAGVGTATGLVAATVGNASGQNCTYKAEVDWCDSEVTGVNSRYAQDGGCLIHASVTIRRYTWTPGSGYPASSEVVEEYECGVNSVYYCEGSGADCDGGCEYVSPDWLDWQEEDIKERYEREWNSRSCR